jgi:hypothetical protein
MCNRTTQTCITVSHISPMLSQIDAGRRSPDELPPQNLDESSVIMALEVSLDDGAHATLPVRRSDSPQQLAIAFGQQHGLSPEAVADVLLTIQDNLEDDALEESERDEKAWENGRNSTSPNGGLTLAEMIAAAMGRPVPSQHTVPSPKALSPISPRDVAVSSPQAFQRAFDPVISAALDLDTSSEDGAGSTLEGNDRRMPDDAMVRTESPRIRLEINTTSPALPRRFQSVIDNCAESGYTCLNILVRISSILLLFPASCPHGWSTRLSVVPRA